MRTSSSVFSSFLTSNDPKPVANDRASMRSTLLCTTPVKRDPPAVHDDVNRRVGHRRVVPERRVAVDRSRDPEAQLVVELRDRQNLDAVVSPSSTPSTFWTRRSRSFFLYGIVTQPLRTTRPSVIDASTLSKMVNCV